MLMDVRPIRDETDHAWALAEIEVYFDDEPAPGTPEAARYEVLVTLVAAWEARERPIAAADPVDVLHFAIRDMGRSQAELADVIGSASRASEILRRRRALTLEMIHRISAAWHIPVAALARPYRLVDERVPSSRLGSTPKRTGSASRVG